MPSNEWEVRLHVFDQGRDEEWAAQSPTGNYTFSSRDSAEGAAERLREQHPTLRVKVLHRRFSERVVAEIGYDAPARTSRPPMQTGSDLVGVVGSDARSVEIKRERQLVSGAWIAEAAGSTWETDASGNGLWRDGQRVLDSQGYGVREFQEGNPSASKAQQRRDFLWLIRYALANERALKLRERERRQRCDD